eukprot:jgi/Botrbrau1/18408/Bobra.0072s0001.1
MDAKQMPGAVCMSALLQGPPMLSVGKIPHSSSRTRSVQCADCLVRLGKTTSPAVSSRETASVALQPADGSPCLRRRGRPRIYNLALALGQRGRGENKGRGAGSWPGPCGRFSCIRVNQQNEGGARPVVAGQAGTPPWPSPRKKQRGAKPKYSYVNQEEALAMRRQRNRETALSSYYKRKAHIDQLALEAEALQADNEALQELRRRAFLCPDVAGKFCRPSYQQPPEKRLKYEG